MNPDYKLLMSYDIRPELQQQYYRYMLGEFVPSMQEAGLMMASAWQVVYGEYPSRHIEFHCEDRETLKDILSGDQWRKAEARLKSFTMHYSRKIVRFEDRFQF